MPDASIRTAELSYPLRLSVLAVIVPAAVLAVSTALAVAAWSGSLAGSRRPGCGVVQPSSLRYWSAATSASVAGTTRSSRSN